MYYVLIERELRVCMRDVNVLRGVTGDERFYHYIVDVKVNEVADGELRSVVGR